MTIVRTPQQPRSIQTKNRIMKAAFALFSQKGIHGTNSKEIVVKAGVSIGSFYSYFKNKKNLLLDILDDYLDRTYLTVWKDMETFTINELTRNDIKFIIENVFKAYEIAPTFMMQTHALRYSDPDINRVFERERKREITQIRYLLENNRHRMRVSDQEAAAIIIHNSVESVVHTSKFLGPKIDEQRLIDELADMIFNFLLHGREDDK